MDGVLLLRRNLPAVREARQVATPTAAADPLEGMEAPENALPGVARARPPRARLPRSGRLAERLLGDLALSPTPASPPQRLLAPDHGPEGLPRPLPRFPGMLSEPPGARPACRVVWEGPGRA